jgi:hypothetical protein
MTYINGISKSSLINDFQQGVIHNDEIFYEVLSAYNRFQEDERGGVDYIFNLNNKEDLICAINGGLTTAEIVCLWKNNAEPTYFLLGCNHPKPNPLLIKDIKNTLVAHLDELIDYIIAYPWVEEYRVLYTRFITNKIIE